MHRLAEDLDLLTGMFEMQGLALTYRMGPAKSEGPSQVKERGKEESKTLEDARLLALEMGKEVRAEEC